MFSVTSQSEVDAVIVDDKHKLVQEEPGPIADVQVEISEMSLEKQENDKIPPTEVGKSSSSSEDNSSVDKSDDEHFVPKMSATQSGDENKSGDELDKLPKKNVNKWKSGIDYDPSSPTEETIDIPSKKPKLDSTETIKEESNKLPDLDKYWKAVNADPTDFTGWTYLLQYVDQENDVEAARTAYDAFLSHYPYCYGYWRKYADYEKRKGNKKKCEEVFERGLKAIPLSVDLWMHYLIHVKSNYGEDEEFIRSQFERAVDACGLEFRSDKLWEACIKWELEGKRYLKVTKLYDRLLGTPTQGYNNHFESFQDFINNFPITATITEDELKRIVEDVRESTSTEPNEVTGVNENVFTNDEITAIKEKIIASRRKIHKANVAAVAARWTYEEGIKRPYFHVKPLEKCQLKNWKEYLDFEIEQGERNRILILFERCLIACALYDEFWLKLIRYLESQNDTDLVSITREAFERACTIHHPDKPSLHLLWSAFEECQKNFEKAANILVNIENNCPNLIQISYRRINLERRRGDYDKCKELYEHYISTAKNKNIAGSLAIKYARFCHKINGDIDAGFTILKSMLEKDPSNTRIVLQMIDLALQREHVDENEVVQIMDKFMSRDGMDLDQKVLFAQRKVEFLEDFGSNAKGLQDAQRALQIALNKANEVKKKSESSPDKEVSKDFTVNTTISTPTTNYNSNATYSFASGTTNSNYYNNNQAYQYDSYGYNHWQQYSTAGYSGYNQWGNYGNYY